MIYFHISDALPHNPCNWDSLIAMYPANQQFTLAEVDALSNHRHTIWIAHRAAKNRPEVFEIFWRWAQYCDGIITLTSNADQCLAAVNDENRRRFAVYVKLGLDKQIAREQIEEETLGSLLEFFGS